MFATSHISTILKRMCVCVCIYVNYLFHLLTYLLVFPSFYFSYIVLFSYKSQKNGNWLLISIREKCKLETFWVKKWFHLFYFLLIFNFIKTVKKTSLVSVLCKVNFMIEHDSHLLILASYSFFCLSISCLRLATRLCRALWLVGPFVTANVSLLSLLLVPLLPRPPPLLVRCSLSSTASPLSSCTGLSNKGSSKLLPKKSCSGHVVVEERQEVEFSGREISQDEVDHVALSTLCLSSQLLLRLGCVVCCWWMWTLSYVDRRFCWCSVSRLLASRIMTWPLGTQSPFRPFRVPFVTSVLDTPIRTTPFCTPILVPEPFIAPVRRAWRVPMFGRVWIFSWLASPVDDEDELNDPLVTIPLPLLNAGFFFTESGGLRATSNHCPVKPLRGLPERGEPLSRGARLGDSGVSQVHSRTPLVLLFSLFWIWPFVGRFCVSLLLLLTSSRVLVWSSSGGKITSWPPIRTAINCWTSTVPEHMTNRLLKHWI